MSDGFFSRWSRRKLQTGAQPVPVDFGVPGQGLSDGDDSLVPGQEGSPRCARDDAAQPRQGRVEDRGQPEPAAPLPTLQDVQALTPTSDFQPFMRTGVAPDVRNAAMKKLFADPHFNVMDGLDIYIDDYSQPDPMPVGMLRRMASAQFLGLAPAQAPVRQDQAPQDPAGSSAPATATQVVAQSPVSSARAEQEPHDHPDLQLQPDPAPADAQPQPSPR